MPGRSGLVIKVYAAAVSAAGGRHGSGLFPKGGLCRDITISSAGLNGQPGKITVGVTLQGFVAPRAQWVQRQIGVSMA